jgi:WD40-like Beta Propeller Repeat
MRKEADGTSLQTIGRRIDVNGLADWGGGMADIYCARFVVGRHPKPEDPGSVINTSGIDHCPFISLDGSCLIFSRLDDGGDLFVSSTRNGESFPYWLETKALAALQPRARGG